jgi:hypothetical protein
MREPVLKVRLCGVRLTRGGSVAVCLAISVGGVEVKYNVYLLKKDIELRFYSTDRSRAELAARLLKLVGVNAEVREAGVEGVWRVRAGTDRLAAGRKELRMALVKAVMRAVERGWVGEEKASRWLKKLERGFTLKEGWPKYNIRLAEGSLEIKYMSINPASIEREAQRLRDIGLEEGRHFTVKMPRGGEAGVVRILREGLVYAAWLSMYGSVEQRRATAEFVEYILGRAWDAGEDVYRKALAAVEEGKARGLFSLRGFEEEVRVNGRRRVVRVAEGGAVLEEGRGGKKFLRIWIRAEVDGVWGSYTLTYSRYGADNKASCYAYANPDAPGGREADAERLAAVVKALTGREPKVYRMKNGSVKIECGRAHLEGFKRFAELADVIARWLEETSRRARARNKKLSY